MRGEEYLDTLPRIVIDGLSFPSMLNRLSLSTLAWGALGLGSLGVPSTRDHAPTVLFHPMMLCSIQQWSYSKKIKQEGSQFSSVLSVARWLTTPNGLFQFKFIHPLWNIWVKSSLGRVDISNKLSILQPI